MGDRSIRTPTSFAAGSAAQFVEQAEEERLVRVVGQDAEDEAAGLADDLAGDGDEGVDKGFELQAQKP